MLSPIFHSNSVCLAIFLFRSVNGAAMLEEFLMNLLKHCSSPTKLRRSVMFVGLGQNRTTLIMSEPILVPVEFTFIPRNSI